ncbi:MAG: FkbM family methyltransferase [Roseburia intestinalis]
MKHMYPEGRSIHSETGEEVKKPEIKIVTEEDVKDSLKGYVPFQNISVDFGGEYGNISYAQFGDDMTIMNLVRQLGLDKPSYLDIGAHHPYVMSNTAMLYQKGCRGINVEADKELLTAFVEERAEDVNIHAVVAGKKGNEIFYHIAKAPGCSTIIQKRAEDFVKEMPEYGPIDEQKVTTITIDDIVSGLCEGGSYPDFLNINIGGNEYDVLAGSDLLYSNGPAIIDVEVDGREHEKFKTLLEENDYFFYTRLGVNEIYVRNKYKDRIVS